MRGVPLDSHITHRAIWSSHRNTHTHTYIYIEREDSSEKQNVDVFNNEFVKINIKENLIRVCIH